MARARLEVHRQVKSEEAEVRSETGGGKNYLLEKPRLAAAAATGDG